MMRKRDMFCLTWLTTAVAVILCMLSFNQPGAAAPRDSKQPFANAVEQRFEIIKLLREQNALIKEQNALLRSGKIRATCEPKQ